jgi:hypothetical protein
MNHRHNFTPLALLLAASCALTASRPPELVFEKQTLDLGASETAAIADVNQDGRPDIISGEYWYAGPAGKETAWKKTKFRDLFYDNNYIDCFSDLPLDVDGDGWTDIVSVSWFSKKISWWRNPQGKGAAGALWKETLIDDSGNVEFAFLVDLDNDGKAHEILPQYGGKVHTAFFQLRNGKFEKIIASPENFGHGIGAGDVNGDGKTDILTPGGWLEAPHWKLHKAWPPQKALSFMHVIDINGDGRNDIVTGNAHDYGFFWMEQMPDGSFTTRMIDDSWSQPHAITMVDLNGDGRMDFVTGKRYMAHNGKDPGEREPLGLYWYEFYNDGKKIQWVKHIIDYSTRTGGGMQLPVADLNGDGRLDLIAPGKSGLFAFWGKPSN